jgi:hypothetical protein
MPINPVGSLPFLNEIVEDWPKTLLVQDYPTRLVGETYPHYWTTAYMVRLRDIGAATYVALGDERVQEARLTVVGQTFHLSVNNGEVIDLTKKFAISDVCDEAIIEISAIMLPFRLYGNVRMVNST